MTIINLEDTKVSYEGQMLPAINLIGKLQTQLREAASRMTAIARTLEDLQTELLNSHTVEVKLTLSKKDYNTLRSLGGTDDTERIHTAVMSVIHPVETETSSGPGASGTAIPFIGDNPAPPPVESRSEITKSSEPIPLPHPEPQATGQDFREQPIAAETAIKKKLITKCPTCQSLIDLPDASSDQWPVELKCGNCGSRCLVKPSFRIPQ